MRRAGHTVRLAAPEMFRALVEEHGLEFAPLAGDPTRRAQDLVERGGVGSNVLQYSHFLTRVNLSTKAKSRQQLPVSNSRLNKCERGTKHWPRAFICGWRGARARESVSRRRSRSQRDHKEHAHKTITHLPPRPGNVRKMLDQAQKMGGHRPKMRGQAQEMLGQAKKIDGHLQNTGGHAHHNRKRVQFMATEPVPTPRPTPRKAEQD